MRLKLLTIAGGVVVVTLLAIMVLPALAQTSDVGGLINGNLQPVKEVYGNQDVSTQSLAITVAEIIKVALGFLAVIFLVLMVYAGFTWMTAAGNDQKITTAKQIMTSAIIGTAIVLTAYAITQFVITQLLIATGAR